MSVVIKIHSKKKINFVLYYVFLCFFFIHRSGYLKVVQSYRSIESRSSSLPCNGDRGFDGRSFPSISPRATSLLKFPTSQRPGNKTRYYGEKFLQSWFQLRSYFSGPNTGGARVGTLNRNRPMEESQRRRGRHVTLPT